MRLRPVISAIAALCTLTIVLAHAQSVGTTIARLPAGLDEVSGLANSRLNPDVFWMHNDSGDRPRVYAVSRSGKLLGTFLLAGAAAVDWEDMAIGPAPDGGSYLYLADIGDNSAQRTSVHIYRVLEPRVDSSVDPDSAPVTRTLSGVVDFEFVYEDGARDAESFFVDPLTNDFYVVSKREADGNRLYRSVAPATARTNAFRLAGKFSFTGATGASISSDGLQVLIRRYSNSVLANIAATYWKRPDASVSLVDLLKQPGRIVPLVQEVQGEAIAFSADNVGFYTTSERGMAAGNPPAPLTFYPSINPAQ